MTGSSNSCVFSFICSVIRFVDIRICECTLVICSVEKLYNLTGSLFVHAYLEKLAYSKIGVYRFTLLYVTFLC